MTQARLFFRRMRPRSRMAYPLFIVKLPRRRKALCQGS
jgi:hypothetical protein